MRKVGFLRSPRPAWAVQHTDLPAEAAALAERALKLFRILVLLSLPLSGIRAQTLQGRLLEAESDAPIIQGELLLLSQSGAIVAQTVSDESGFFSLTAPRPGSFLLRAERMGYQGRVEGVFDLGEGSSMTLEFRLLREPVTLDTLGVSVEARSMRLELAGFYDRRQDHMGVFLDTEAIDAKQATLPTHLFRNIPRIRIRQQPMGRSAIVIQGAAMISLANRGICYPRVLVDGNEVFPGGEVPAQLDEVVGVSEIAGIEIYRGPAEIPSRYHGARSACGLILVWTK